MTLPYFYLIFDMDGPLVASISTHDACWARFLHLGERELKQATSGRTGVETMRELFGAALPQATAQAYVREKESMYRAAFAPRFRWVAGFERFARRTR